MDLEEVSRFEKRSSEAVSTETDCLELPVAGGSTAKKGPAIVAAAAAMRVPTVLPWQTQWPLATILAGMQNTNGFAIAPAHFRGIDSHIATENMMRVSQNKSAARSAQPSAACPPRS